ncbi:hypothetical protein ACP6PL_09645 [Dapis sp. BLCC M126]|uniref:hypothetical protein n=1 Tax=Dapis sp. BLCC M126 TaxID=3400189 RepID=UPI003CF2DA42
MKTTQSKLLTTAFVLGSVALGTLGQAQEAAALVLQTLDKTNNVNTDAFKDMGIHSNDEVLEYFLAEDYANGQHAFWFSGNDGDSKYYHWYGDALFYTFDEDENGKIDGARLLGYIQDNDSDTADSGQFEVDLTFTFRGKGTNGEGWGGQKTEQVSKSFAKDQADKWKYFDIDTSKSTLTGLGSYEGTTLNLFDHSAGRYPVQFGYGANAKNEKLGLATWFEDIDSDILVKQNGNPRELKDLKIKHLDQQHQAVKNLLKGV